MIIAVLGVLSPLSAGFVSLTNPSINPKPLDRVENNGVGIISFGMAETSNTVSSVTDIMGSRNIEISLEMNKLQLTGGDVDNITGTLMEYFTATYNEEDKRIIFTQIAEFPGLGAVKVIIPVEVTENSKATDNSLNGFTANISANDADTVAHGNTSEFTYTK